MLPTSAPVTEAEAGRGPGTQDLQAANFGRGVLTFCGPCTPLASGEVCALLLRIMDLNASYRITEETNSIETQLSKYLKTSL